MTKTTHIGIFDSGIGGLSVANAVLNAIPAARITYLGDNAFFPYGEKTEDVIRDRLERGLDYLLEQQCDIIVIACNTASIVADKLPLDPSGVEIIPVTRPVIEKLSTLSIGSLSIIATPFTVNSGYYERQLKDHPTLRTIRAFARPDLVRLVEHAEDPTAVKLDNYHDTVDAFLLGCTHFHFLKKSLAELLAPQTVLLDSADLATEYLLLRHISLDYQEPAPIPRIRFIFTDTANPPKWPIKIQEVWGAEFGSITERLKR